MFFSLFYVVKKNGKTNRRKRIEILIKIVYYALIMVRVKICGITNTKDAVFCSENGADALGFVFYDKSPRYVCPKSASEIIKDLPPFISIVGLFVNESPDEVRRISDLCRLDILQFHGDETSEYVNSFERKKIKAFRIKERVKEEDIIDYDVDAYLFDAYAKGLYGGSGEKFNWSAITEQKFTRPVILAGGLKPENIIDAVDAVQPYAVDVSSGVESERGVKNLNEVKKFIIRAKHGRIEKQK